MMKKIIADNKGFSLIEAMVAIAIIAVGVMAMYSLQIGSVNSNSHGNRITISTDLAADKIEEIMALNYTDADLTTGLHTETGQDASTINWTVNPSWTTDPLLANSKKITVSVTTGKDTSTIEYIKCKP